MCKKGVVNGFLQHTNFFMWRLTHFSHESTKVLAAQSCPTLFDPMDCSPPDSMGFSRQEYWSGLPFPFPGVFPTQGSSPGVLHDRPILYPLSHQESAFLSWTPLKKWVYMIFCFKREKKKKKKNWGAGWKYYSIIQNIHHWLQNWVPNPKAYLSTGRILLNISGLVSQYHTPTHPPTSGS